MVAETLCGTHNVVWGNIDAVVHMIGMLLLYGFTPDGLQVIPPAQIGEGGGGGGVLLHPHAHST